jgi:hypothetical protein
MKIHGTNKVTPDVSANAAKAVREASRTSLNDGSAADASPKPRADRVELSAQGKALSRAALTPERTTQIRQNILQGAYDATHVVEQVAKRILSNGDL